MGHTSGHLNDQGEFVMEDEEEDFDFDDEEIQGVEATSQSAQEKQVRSQQVYIEQLEDSNLKLQERIWILEQQLLAVGRQSDQKQGDSDDESLGRGRSPRVESDVEGILGLGGPVAIRGVDFPVSRNGEERKGGDGDDESIQASAA